MHLLRQNGSETVLRPYHKLPPIQALVLKDN